MVAYGKSQILHKFSLTAKSLFATLLLGLPLSSFSYEAVQLVQVPLDQSIGCTRHFFRSSTAYNNVIFSVPRIIAGNGIIKTKGLQVNKVVQVAKMKNGFYDVTLYMYFPKHEERVGSSLSIYATSDSNTCDYDKVRAALKVSKGKGEDTLPVIAPMPLTSIDVKIFGIAKAGRVGSAISNTELERDGLNNEELTNLDYDGKSLPVRFILSEDEYEKFSFQIQHKNGLDAEVTVRFQGRKRSGSITATFATEEIINNLSAAVKGGKVATSAELKMKLNDTVMSKHINIQVEDPSVDQNGLFEKIKTKMIDDIASEVFASSAGKKKKESEVKEDGKDKKEDKEQASLKAVGIAVLAERIRVRLQGEVQYTQYTAPSEATSKLKLNFSTERINDPEAEDITVSENASKFTSIKLNKGDSIKLIPISWYKNSVSYNTNKEYLSKSEIVNLKLSNYFNDLANSNIVVKDNNATGTAIAEGIITTSWHPSWVPDSVARYKYLWLRTQKEVIESRIGSDDYNNKRKLEDFKALEVSFAFDGINYRRKYSPTEILEEKENWVAKYNENEGVLTLTAKRNLGVLGFYPKFKDEEKKDKQKKETKKDSSSQKTEQEASTADNQQQGNQEQCGTSDAITAQPKSDDDKAKDLNLAAKKTTEAKNSTSNKTNDTNNQCKKKCQFDMPMTKEQLSQCNNIPALVLDSVMQVRVDRLTGEIKSELEYIIQSDDNPMRTKRSIILSIKRPEFVTEK